MTTLDWVVVVLYFALERGFRIWKRHPEPGRSLPLLLSGQRCRGGSQVTPVAGREILLDRGRVPAVT